MFAILLLRLSNAGIIALPSLMFCFLESLVAGVSVIHLLQPFKVHYLMILLFLHLLVCLYL